LYKLDNIKHTGLKNEKFSTRGTHGLVGAFSFIKYWSGETRGYFKQQAAVLNCLNGCLSEQDAAAWHAPNRRGSTALLSIG
jgi:hypothetical protein